MSAVWKVGANTFETLKVSECAISLQNMSADMVTLSLAQQFDGALPAVFGAYGTAVSITRDGLQVFYGYRGRPGFRMGRETARTVKLFNAWGWLEMTPYVGTAGYFNDTTGTWPIARIGSGNIGALVTAVLGNISGLYAIGAVDLPAYTVDAGEIRGQYYAGVIRSILRTVPDAAVTFDYATTPPRIYVLAPTGTTMVSFPLFDSYGWAVEEADAEECPDLVATAVTVDHVVPFSRTATTYAPNFSTGAANKAESRSDGLFRSLRDAAGSGAGARNTIWALSETGGSFESRTWSYVQPSVNWLSLGISLGWYFSYQASLPHYPNLWRLLPNFAALASQYPWLSASSPNYFQVVGYRGRSEVFDASLVTSSAGWKTDRTIVPPEACIPPEELWRSAAFPTGYDVGEIDVYMRFDQASPGTGVFETTVTVPVMSTYAAGSSSLSRNGQTLFREIVTSAGTVTSTAGAAAQVLAQAGQLRGAGSARLRPGDDGEYIPVAPAARKVGLVGGSTAIIQRIDHRVFSGRTDLQFGPPAHLRPDDLRGTL